MRYGEAMASLKHELWEDPEGLNTFCLAGPDGAGARGLLPAGSKLIWTVDAGSCFEAMTRYYTQMGWGEYTTDQEWDRQPYPDAWLTRQLSGQS